MPVTAPNGFILKIIGDDVSVADDYYVKFQTSDGSDFSQGSWVECPQPDIQYKIDSSTMPHALVLEEDGTFTLDVIDWPERKAGDEDTAPTPSFIGNAIQEVLTYKGRFILSYNDCPEIRELCKEFNIIEVSRHKGINNINVKDNIYKELIIRNF